MTEVGVSVFMTPEAFDNPSMRAFTLLAMQKQLLVDYPDAKELVHAPEDFCLGCCPVGESDDCECGGAFHKPHYHLVITAHIRSSL